MCIRDRSNSCRASAMACCTAVTGWLPSCWVEGFSGIGDFRRRSTIVILMAIWEHPTGVASKPIMTADELEQLRPSLSDRYELIRRVGRGATATVYLARDIRHD